MASPSWLMHPRVRFCFSVSPINYFITVAVSFLIFFAFLFVFPFLVQSKTRLQVKYIPMVQFNRGDVSKQEVITNARRALKKVDEYQFSADEENKDPKTIFENVIVEMIKKEKRQFLALQAFGIHNSDDFESLVDLGFESDPAGDYTAENDYRSWNKRIEVVAPDYERLCYTTSFTVSNAKRPMEETFCSRLRKLESDIRRGIELPLLTLYTWWLDPITDAEVLSKRAVFANWNLFRPFIIPVVLTNFRMNMAVANAHGWPCLPVDVENEDQLPVFKYTAASLERTLTSTFYGYAMSNSMFDSSLLQTLLSVKDKFVKAPGTNSVNAGPTSERFVTDERILIHGRPLKVPALGLETFEKLEYFHKHVETVMHRNESAATSAESSYVIYRGIDFADDADVVIDDSYLIAYLIKRHSRYDNRIIDSSETVLSAKTHRHLSVNEWGRRYIRLKERDHSYNRRKLDELTDEDKELNSSVKSKLFMTLYDERHGVRVLSIKQPPN